MKHDTRQGDSDSDMPATDEDLTWWQEYALATVAILCGVGSVVALASGIVRALTAQGEAFFQSMHMSLRVSTVLAGVGTLAGIWAVRRGRSAGGLTLCGGMLIACGVMWAWIAGYIYWI